MSDHEIKYMVGLKVLRADFRKGEGTQQDWVQIDFDDMTSIVVEGDNLVYSLIRTELTEL